MKVFIDRTTCPDCSSFCDRHIAKLIRFPLGENRPCITKIEDDGQDYLTVDVTDGINHATLTLTEAQREIMALEGLSPFLPWFRHKGGSGFQNKISDHPQPKPRSLTSSVLPARNPAQ